MRDRRHAFLDFGSSSLKVLAADRGIELGLERTATGTLTPARGRVAIDLRSFLEKSGSRRVICGLPARGVSLRRLALPRASREETRRLLGLQLENELPLEPEKLAWGYVFCPTASSPALGRAANGKGTTRDVLVVALRREIFEEYSSLLAECGFSATFTLGALATSALCPTVAGHYSVLDLGRTHAELVTLADGVPVSVRSLSWGGENVDRALGEALGISALEAESVKRAWSGNPARAPSEEGPPRDERITAALHGSVEDLARLLAEVWERGVGGNGTRPPGQVFLTGGSSRLRGLSEGLLQALEPNAIFRPLAIEAGPARSSVTLGLEREEQGGQDRRLVAIAPAKVKPASERKHRSPLRRWLAAAVLLLIALAGVRYGVPLWRLPELNSRLAEAERVRASLPKIDSELEFLEFVTTSQLPCLEALAAVAGAAAQGTLLESLSMSRQGEMFVQGQSGSFQQVGELREKMIKSGLFSRVVFQDQSPTKDEKRWQFRLSAELKPSAPSAPSGPQPPERSPGDAPADRS